MERIGEILKQYHKSYPGNEDAVWNAVDKMGDVLCSYDKKVVERMRMQMHEDFCGPHYNKEIAESVVDKMYRKSDSGDVVYGGHWSLAQVQEVFTAYKSSFKNPKDNVYDLYVALNATYNDLVRVFKSDFPENYEKKIVEYAIVFWFKDDDAPEGKIWRYMSVMQ